MSIIQTNISSWTPYEVGEWLKGLEDFVRPYVKTFITNNVNGKKLLDLTHADLRNLKLEKVGHQELIIQAIQLLNSLQYDLNQENIQHLAFKLRCKSLSLQNEVKIRTTEKTLLIESELQNGGRIDSPSLPRSHNKHHKRRDDQKKGDFEKIKLAIPVLSAISDIVEAIKVLINWLDRSPFDSMEEFFRKRRKICTLGIELITAARGDNGGFTQSYLESNLGELVANCDEIIRDFNDPLVTMGPSLEVATVRKQQDQQLKVYGGHYTKRLDSRRDSDNFEEVFVIYFLGIHIQSTHYGTHMIEDVKDNSPAKLSGKLEFGDELIQVNRQTIVGWSLPKLVELLQNQQENKEIHLTVKKRPKLPSSRTVKNFRSGRMNICGTLPSRTNAIRPSSSSQSPGSGIEDTKDDHDNDEVFDSDAPLPTVMNLSAIEKQRRATVSGGSPTNQRPSNGSEASTDSSPDGALQISSSPTRKLLNKKNSDFFHEPDGGSPRLLRVQKLYSTRRTNNEGQITAVKMREHSKSTTSISPSIFRKGPRRNFELESSTINRRISVKDLGQGDFQGWMYQRERKSLIGANWPRRWCVLKKNVLLVYKSQESNEAHARCIISNASFVSPGKGTRKYAIEIGQKTDPQKAVCFATAQADFHNWLFYLQAAHTLYKKHEEEVDKDEAYSDTDDESSNRSQKSITSSREELDDMGTSEIIHRRQQKVALEEKKSMYEEKLESKKAELGCINNILESYQNDAGKCKELLKKYSQLYLKGVSKNREKVNSSNCDDESQC